VASPPDDIPPRRTVADLKSLTPARVGLGHVGASLPTSALLAFTLDHARARDAVHAPFDSEAIAAGLDALDATSEAFSFGSAAPRQVLDTVLRTLRSGSMNLLRLWVQLSPTAIEASDQSARITRVSRVTSQNSLHS
jgi:Ethanolamine ammonia-lyase light chain (EutC)